MTVTKEPGARELLVGTVITVGIIVAVVGTLWLRGTTWGRPATVVEVWTREVGLLTAGNPVTYRGVPIGRVSDIVVDPSGAFVRVRARLDGEVAMPEDTYGLIAAQSLFGDWMLEITTRTAAPRANFYDVPPFHTENEVRILGGYAQPDVTRLTAVADEIAENIATLTDRIERTFTEETAEQIVQLVHNLRQLSDDVGDMIGQQARAFETVTAEVERAATEISAAAAAGRRTLERVDVLMARGDIDSILVNVRTATRSIDELAVGFGATQAEIGFAVARADTVFQGLGRVLASVEAGQGSIGRLFTDPTLALRAEGVLAQLELLIADVRANPGRYVRLSLF